MAKGHKYQKYGIVERWLTIYIWYLQHAENVINLSPVRINPPTSRHLHIIHN